MNDVDEIICRLSEGTISQVERKRLYALLRERPDKLDEIHAILFGSNCCLCDFEEIILPNKKSQSILHDTATFITPNNIIHGKKRFGGLKIRELSRHRLAKMASDIMQIE